MHRIYYDYEEDTYSYQSQSQLIEVEGKYKYPVLLPGNAFEETRKVQYHWKIAKHQNQNQSQSMASSFLYVDANDLFIAPRRKVDHLRQLIIITGNLNEQLNFIVLHFTVPPKCDNQQSRCDIKRGHFVHP
eukprot:scaffold6289_cov109-Skeletonema_dohrnii-CCMP3373.AAC.2